MRTIPKNTEFYSTAELNNFVRLYENSTNDIEILALGGARAELKKREGEAEYNHLKHENARLEKELESAEKELDRMELDLDDTNDDLYKSEGKVFKLKNTLQIIIEKADTLGLDDFNQINILTDIKKICNEALKAEAIKQR